MTEENNKKNYMGWVTLSMFVYITVISFEDPFLPLPRIRSVCPGIMDHHVAFLSIALHINCN